MNYGLNGLLKTESQSLSRLALIERIFVVLHLDFLIFAKNFDLTLLHFSKQEYFVLFLLLFFIWLEHKPFKDLLVNKLHLIDLWG